MATSSQRTWTAPRDVPHKSKAARRAYQRRWAREVNPVARRDSKRRWASEHLEAGRRATARYLRRRRERTFERSDGRCYLCRAPIDLATFHVDHRVPVSRGGVDDERNRIAACRSCNQRKWVRTASEFLAWLRARGELPLPLDADGLPDWSLTEEDEERVLTTRMSRGAKKPESGC